MIKKTVLLFASAAVILFLGGCETLEEFDFSTVKFPVYVVSEPAGAVIEINDNYVGKTPLTVELEGWKTTRTFVRSHTIVAHPLKAGGQTQVKSFTGWSSPDKSYGDTIPEKIYFNMNLVRIR